MKSPITRSATVAAIFIAAIVSMALLDKSARPAYGITDIPELFKKARIIHVQGWRHLNLTDRGKKVPKVPVERWIDLENGRASSTGEVVKAGPEGVTVTLRKTVVNGQYKMVVDHGKKKTVFYRLSDYQEKLQAHYRWHDMFGYLYGNIETFEKFVKAG